jgi:hypothetical protein
MNVEKARNLNTAGFAAAALLRRCPARALTCSPIHQVISESLNPSSRRRPGSSDFMDARSKRKALGPSFRWDDEDIEWLHFSPIGEKSQPVFPAKAGIQRL